MKAVLVTTKWRGVFFGYTIDAKFGESVELADARMCIYWDEACNGVVGLAEFGPIEGSKVSAQTEKVTLHGVTAVFEVTEQAEKVWLGEK